MLDLDKCEVKHNVIDQWHLNLHPFNNQDLSNTFFLTKQHMRKVQNIRQNWDAWTEALTNGIDDANITPTTNFIIQGRNGERVSWLVSWCFKPCQP